METIYLREGGYVVSAHALTTPKAVHRLSDISSVSVRYQVALSALLPAAGLAGGTLMFARYLYVPEIAVLLGICIAILIAASSVGTLTVNSLALSHAPELRQTWGRIGQLKRVRAAVAAAMAAREVQLKPSVGGLS